MDQSQPDTRKEEICLRVAVHNNKKKHTKEMRVTKLTCNQTGCPYFQQQHEVLVEQHLCN